MFRRATLLIGVLVVSAVASVAKTGATAEAERDAIRAEADVAATEDAALRARLAVLERQQAADLQQDAPARARLTALNVQEQTLSDAIAQNRGELGRLLSALQLFSRDPPPALLVSPRSANDAVTAAILMRAVTPELRRRADIYAAQEQAYRLTRRQSALAQAAVFSEESETAERRAEIERTLAESAGARARLAVAGQGVDAVARAAAEHDALLGGLVAGVHDREPALAGAFAAAARLQPPVQGTRAVGFGATLSDGTRSNGLVWRGAPAGQVWAPASGLVEYAGPLKGWGQVVIISLGGDWRLVLAGLDRLSVTAGSTVTAGQGVGLLNRSAAPELYMELRNGAEASDPAKRLDAG